MIWCNNLGRSEEKNGSLEHVKESEYMILGVVLSNFWKKHWAHERDHCFRIIELGRELEVEVTLYLIAS